MLFVGAVYNVCCTTIDEWFIQHCCVFSERELTFAICRRPSVCPLSVTLVHPTQAIEISTIFLRHRVPMTSSSQLDGWSISPLHSGLTDRAMMIDVPHHAHLTNAGAVLMKSVSLHDPPASAADHRSLPVPTISPMTMAAAFWQ